MASNSETFGSESEIENVSVVVRVRPLNVKGRMQNFSNVKTIKINDRIIELIDPKVSKTQNKSFRFDHVFSDDSTQMEVYRRVALPIVNQIFNGYNGTIFAYGQTGSGKTFTMLGNQGDDDTQGIIPNTFAHIFGQIARAGGQKSFVVTVTYLEIYNEEVRNLLSPKPDEKLEIRENKGIGVYVRGLTGLTVDSVDAMNRLMGIGNSNRKTRATLMNDLSSRSHAIFTVTVEVKDCTTNQTTVAKLNLVDLAGSERLKDTEATGIGLKEAIDTNQSLFALSNVLSALAEEKSNHIPYRNSKLTRLLRDSLGGNSKTLMIATISPNATDFEESLRTLRYAGRAKLIKNHIRPNVQTSQGLIENFEREILRLQMRLKEVSSSEEVQRPTSRKTDQNSKSRKEQLIELKTIENVKNELNKKIELVQKKILIGGQNVLDMAENQKLLLESSFEEINNLDKRHQELQEVLEEKKIKNTNLKEQHRSLNEEDKTLDDEIQLIEKLLKKTTAKYNEEQQDHKQEMQLLSKHNLISSKELQLTSKMISLCIPSNQMKRIESNVVWNSETCDYQINGVAHLGNNVKQCKRRFTKHIPESAPMESLLNVRKNMIRENKVAFERATTNNVYSNYLRRQKYEKSESGVEKGKSSAETLN